MSGSPYRSTTGARPPAGLRLYRYFQPAADDGLDTALRLLTTQPPDPDYRPAWPEGAFVDGVVRDDAIEVEVSPTLAADLAREPGPGGMTADDAVLGIQQVVYTVQAVTQQRLPVRFLAGGEPMPRLVGLDVSQTVSRAPDLDTLAPVSISDPAEGEQVSGSFLARGVADSFEATVPWEIRDTDGTVVSSGFATAEGFGDRLYPWQVEVDVADLTPGRYTFVASTSDPSGGAEGAGPTSDTRTVVVR